MAESTANCLPQDRDTYMIGLINTAYTIGAIVAGFFLGGPTVSYSNGKPIIVSFVV